MSIPADKLESRLAGGLAPVYLISGDDPLLAMEAADLVRAAARAAGHTERLVLTVDRTFDWATLAAEGASLSLFAEKKLIELRMEKPGKEGGEALAAYAASPSPDAVLLVLAGRLDKRSASAAWVKALAAAGEHVQVRPVERQALPGWVARRMRGAGLAPSAEVARLIADRVEGNLLAADQEIRKLALLAGGDPLDEEAVLRAVADSARFDVFQLVDACDAGELARGQRILAGLEAEGVEAPMVLWALARELRTLAQAGFQIDRGGRAASVLAKAGIWPRRQPVAQQALRRHGVRGLQRLLARAGHVDRVIKGAVPGLPWQALADLVTALASTPAQRGAA